MATMDAGAITRSPGRCSSGARPGDVLEIEMVDILPQPHAFTAIVPGLGFLRDLYTTPYLVKWRIADGWATSPELPGVRIPGAPFMGVIGVAPSHDQLRAWTVREQACLERGGLVMVPDAAGAVPGTGRVATEGLRTISPRENGGNMDIKQSPRLDDRMPVPWRAPLLVGGWPLRPGRRRGLCHRRSRWAPPPWCASAW